MEIKVYKNVLIVYLKGEVDQHKVSGIKGDIDKKIRENNTSHLIYDFSEVGFMDSSGIGMVLSRYKSFSGTNSKLYLCNVSDNTMRLFDMVGLKDIIKIFGSVDECLMQI